jgi:hypothetical protein
MDSGVFNCFAERYGVSDQVKYHVELRIWLVKTALLLGLGATDDEFELLEAFFGTRMAKTFWIVAMKKCLRENLGMTGCSRTYHNMLQTQVLTSPVNSALKAREPLDSNRYLERCEVKDSRRERNLKSACCCGKLT